MCVCGDVKGNLCGRFGEMCERLMGCGCDVGEIRGDGGGEGVRRDVVGV